MPWKLIAFLAILLLITLFIGFNLDNRCDVSFIFYKYQNVPIFVSLLFSYAAGAITVIPFFIGHGFKRASKGKGTGAGKGAPGTKDAASGSGSGKNAVKGTAFRKSSARARSADRSGEYDID